MRTMLMVATMLCACGAKVKDPDLASDREQRSYLAPGDDQRLPPPEHQPRWAPGDHTNLTSAPATSPAPKPAPVEVKRIKRAAIPKGNYSLVNASEDYPAEARQLGIEGAIRVRLLVDEEGNIRSAELLNRLGHGLDELALARVNQIAFEPARDLDDRPVASIIIWTFHMKLSE